jgi:hypothetical protein
MAGTGHTVIFTDHIGRLKLVGYQCHFCYPCGSGECISQSNQWCSHGNLGSQKNPNRNGGYSKKCYLCTEKKRLVTTTPIKAPVIQCLVARNPIKSRCNTMACRMGDFIKCVCYRTERATAIPPPPSICRRSFLEGFVVGNGLLCLLRLDDPATLVDKGQFVAEFFGCHPIGMRHTTASSVSIPALWQLPNPGQF